MVSVVKENMANYFLFDDEVVFGTVSWGGCKSLEKKYTSSMKEKAMEDGFYILGLCVKDGGGYNPTVNVKYDENNYFHECVYVIGEYKNGSMHEIITDRKIDYVDDVEVIRFNAPRNHVRFSNNTWQECPVIDNEEYEPGYYFSDLCYVNCNKISRKDVIEYLEYFNDKFDIFIGRYNDKLDSMQKNLIYEYNRISNAFNKVSRNKVESCVKVHTKILAHKYGVN